jgi:hypothetical protein
MAESEYWYCNIYLLENHLFLNFKYQSEVFYQNLLQNPCPVAKVPDLDIISEGGEDNMQF